MRFDLAHLFEHARVRTGDCSRLHNMRHALKTWMQKARIPKDVRNAVQSHYDGGMDELCGRYSFQAEKRDALDRWAAHVLSLIS